MLSGIFIEGIGNTLTNTDAVSAKQFFESVPMTVYVKDDTGADEVTESVLFVTSEAGSHLYNSAPVAFKYIVVPKHTVSGALTDTLAGCFTSTVIESLAVHP